VCRNGVAAVPLVVALLLGAPPSSAYAVPTNSSSPPRQPAVHRSPDAAKQATNGRAPSCGGCVRRESAHAQTMRLQSYGRVLSALGPIYSSLLAGAIALSVGLAMQHFFSRDLLATLFYVLLYLIASPTAILVNKVLMKDYGFGYPVLVSALGQSTTAVTAFACVRCGVVRIDSSRRVDTRSLVLLGGATALALVLGQYPYLYLTVAFIQMLKAFSPAYMVCFLYCLGVENPSRRVIACVLGLSVFTAIASAGEVNFNLVGVMFMASASISDALRLVVAQKLLRNQKMHPIETLYYISPICVAWMFPAALLTELPTAMRTGSLHLVSRHPAIFIASGISGAFVNLTSYLLVKRTSSMTLKTLTMARNGGLVIVSALIMGETITWLEGVGYTGLLGCFAIYTYVKATEGSAKAPPAAKPDSTELQRLTPDNGGSGDEADGANTLPPRKPAE